MTDTISHTKRTGIFKTPLVYVFALFGMAIGRQIGLAMNPVSPDQAGTYVAVGSIAFGLLAGGFGYIIASGINASVSSVVSRILLKWSIGIIGLFVYLIMFAALNKSVTGDAVAANPSSFDSYNLKYGIAIKLPRHWRVLDKQLMDSIDTNTEIMTGIGQGNNDIVIAANYYDSDTSDALATARVSVRTKQTASQIDVAAITQSDLDAQADQAYKITLSMLDKSGDGETRITPYKMTMDEISGYIAVRADYQEIVPSRTKKVTIYTIYLGNRIVKVTMSYDTAQKSLLVPTINKIKKSIRIRK